MQSGADRAAMQDPGLPVGSSSGHYDVKKSSWDPKLTSRCVYMQVKLKAGDHCG